MLSSTDPSASKAVARGLPKPRDVSGELLDDERLLWLQRVIYYAQPDDWRQGQYGGLLAITDQRVLFTGHDASGQWPYTDVRAVRYQRGGRTIFGASSTLELVERGGSRIHFALDQSHRSASDRLATIVEGQIRIGGKRRPTPAAPPLPAAPMASVADEVAKLSELHSRGALDDDEFARAKARLIEHGGTPTASKAARVDAPEAVRGVQEIVRNWTHPISDVRTCRRCGAEVQDNDASLREHIESHGD